MTEKARRASRAADPKDPEILLGVLTAVQRDANISQRSMSQELGVALGLTNAYLKRCIRKGWIKVRQVPSRRYLYYLTSQGFAEKTRLTGEYLAASFTFFRRARGQMSELMDHCARKGWRRVAFVGVSDLAEIGIVCAAESQIELVGIIERDSGLHIFCGLPVFAGVKDCAPFDAVIITGLERSRENYMNVKDEIDPTRVLVPRMLETAVSSFKAA